MNQLNQHSPSGAAAASTAASVSTVMAAISTPLSASQPASAGPSGHMPLPSQYGGELEDNKLGAQPAQSPVNTPTKLFIVSRRCP
jgi:hypothetical protein